MGIMTPTEDWSDLGSDTTEIDQAPAITRHGLQLCGYATANFMRLISEIRNSLEFRRDPAVVVVDDKDLQRLYKAYDELVVHLLHALDAPVPSQNDLLRYSSPGRAVRYDRLTHVIKQIEDFSSNNNDIEQSFGHLPGSTLVGTADIEIMHKAFGNLVKTLLFNLGAPIPFRNNQFAPAPAPAPVSAPAAVSNPFPAPEVPRAVVPALQSEICDKTLEAIINSMDSTPTEEDIMKLVFHWTTLGDCNGFKRAEVMQFD